MVLTFSFGGGLGGLFGGGFGLGPGPGLGPGLGPGPGNLGSGTTDTSGPNSSNTPPADSPSTTLTVIGTTPSDGSTLSGSVSTVSVLWDRPIDAGSLFGDFELRRIGPQGNAQVTDPFLLESLDPTDPHTVQLSLSAPLQPGNYQIVLLGFNSVQGVDGAFIDTMGQDDVLATFTVAKAGATLADAQYLGVVRSNLLTVPGSLDFETDPSSVALYSFVVPGGSPRRLGAEIQAQRIGSPVDTVLTLFDANGHVLATDDNGRPGAPFDPYLFQTLPGGLYYLGVSGAGNTPGTPGGYDVIHGYAGTGALAQPGGPFQLQIVADPITGRTTVTNFQTDSADPDNSQPTGFSIGFSGAIQTGPSGSSLADSVGQDLVLVDQNGLAWPIVAVAYNESRATLTYVFQQALPAGHYRLELPGQGGLTDLDGRAPVASGEPDGVLAEFDVAADPVAPTSENLGPIYPGPSNLDTLPSLKLQPGETWSARFVTLADGLTSLKVVPGAGLVQVDLYNASGTLSQTFTTDSGRTTVPLDKGVWTVRVRAVTGSPNPIDLFLISRKMESLLENGVGQGPALGLRFLSTSPSTPTPGNPTPSGGGGDPSSPVLTPTPGSGSNLSYGPATPQPGTNPDPSGATGASPSGSVSLAAMPGAPGSLPLTFGGQPVGRSEAGAEHVPAVGPDYVSGSVAYASNSSMPPTQRLDQPDSDGPLTVTDARDPLSPRRSPRHGHSDNHAGRDRNAEPETDGALLSEAELPPVDAPPEVINLPGLSDRLRSAISNILASAQQPGVEVPTQTGSILEEEGRVEAAILTSPIHLAVGAFVAVQSRRTLARWLGRRSRWKQAASRAYRPSTPSPHLGRRSVRVNGDTRNSLTV